MKHRNLQIELLRILAMFMIVLGHAFTYGHALENFGGGKITFALILLIKTCTIPGTDIFVLISGYFLINTKPSVKRILTVWIQILFYSLGIYLVLAVTGLESLSIVELIKHSLPVAFNKYWFMRVYFYLLLCAPFLNILLHSLSEKGYRVLILLGVLLMVIPASIPVISVFNKEAGNGILWFMLLYVTGAYFSKHPPKRKVHVYFVVAALMIFFAWASRIGVDFISAKLGFDGVGSSRFSTFDSFPIYLFSVCMLCAAICYKKREQSANGVVLFFSGSTAGIYMIHEHPLVRSLLWGKLQLADADLWTVFLSGFRIYILAAIVDNLTWKQISKIVNRINTERIDRSIHGIEELMSGKQ